VYIDELNQKNSAYNSIANQQANKNKQAPKKNILAQNNARPPRKFSLRWVLAISSIPLFGIYAAFGLSPQTTTHDIETALIVEEVLLPDAQRLSTTNNHQFIYKERVKRNDSLNKLLGRLNIHDKAATTFIRNQVAHTEAQKLKAGQSFVATVNQDGKLRNLDYQLSDDQVIHIEKTRGGEYTAKHKAVTLEKRSVLKSATIKRSLFDSTDKANIPDAVANQIINIFESEVDFHKVHKGDRLKVVYEASYRNGDVVKSGNILAVEFTNKNKTHHAIGFLNKKGVMEYYSPLGKTLHKSFLRSPLAFTRVTSGFSKGRFHPVLQRIRAHKGVDMAAPTGTKIRATGDAVVKFVGRKGGYGRVIILKHDKGVKTVYGHLSRFAKNLKVGQKIEQGHVIGYVGQSGMATGPHLHYEFLLNGKHRDPMKVALPRTQTIAKKDKVKFLQNSRHLMTKLQLLEHTNIAALD
jgi:murein DD-endopeptidase MepM/ murein hydrolase activator NlpD